MNNNATNLFEVPASTLTQLARTPQLKQTVGIGKQAYHISINIPDSLAKINKHYAPELKGKRVEELARELGFAIPNRHMGIKIEFMHPTELHLFKEDLVLASGIQDLIKEYGAISFANAHTNDTMSNLGQRNIFPSLDFHFDRSPIHPNPYTCLFRDPFDPNHLMPRVSSTLILDYVVAYLQYLREGNPLEECKRSLYHIFEDQRISDFTQSIMLEYQWNQPKGTGEICILDNRTTLHASYYGRKKGYAIGARYLFY